MRANQGFVLRLTSAAVLIAADLAMSAIAFAACPDPANTTNTCLGTGALESNIDGGSNTAIGWLALRENTSGSDNTGIGRYALISNTTGSWNTAVGSRALSSNTTGTFNVAGGLHALEMNTTGLGNTALGVSALQHNSTANGNTAVGLAALQDNQAGVENVAMGFFAARFGTGNRNTATGFEALSGSIGIPSTGHNNTANGHRALFSNASGGGNTATGVNALFGNTEGFYNTANGTGALKHTTTGYRNVGLGYQAGYNISTGSDNIVIGGGNQGRAADDGVIRIGTSAYQKKVFIAGIRGVTTGLSATAVFIDANGQLGTIKSSREAKEDVRPMENVSERLLALRPVTFRYKVAHENGIKPMQFGLIAEEVAEAFPELVIYDENGEPETVAYHLLATLLLNEFQKQATRIAALEKHSAELAQLKQELAQMAAVIERLDREKMVATTR